MLICVWLMWRGGGWISRCEGKNQDLFGARKFAVPRALISRDRRPHGATMAPTTAQARSKTTAPLPPPSPHPDAGSPSGYASTAKASYREKTLPASWVPGATLESTSITCAGGSKPQSGRRRGRRRV